MRAAGAMLAASTLFSEDAATLAAGALVASDTLSLPSAIGWVAFGIWAGDIGLFAIGRLARRIPMLTHWVDRRWSLSEIRAMEVRLNRGAAIAILWSRFLPGTRVVLYVAAGVLHVRASTFAMMAAVASLAWTTMVVSAVGTLGALW